MLDVLNELLKAVAEDPSSEHMSLVMESLDKDMLKEEAVKAMSMLGNSFVNPELLFADVTDEQIEKEKERLVSCYGEMLLYATEQYGEEYCAERVRSDPDDFLGMTEDDVREIAEEDGGYAYGSMMDTMTMAHDHDVVIMGTLGRWNGQKKVAKICSNIDDAVSLMNGDSIAVFLKDGELRLENCHHDGTDRFIVRKLKDSADPEEVEWYDQDKILVETESLYDLMKERFFSSTETKKGDE